MPIVAITALKTIGVYMQKFTGLEYLLIDVANNFGLDKEPWDKRIQWVKDNDKDLESFKNKADSPNMYAASVDALRAVQRGEPIGYGISLDATASGTQWLAILTGDKQAAELCNVINIGSRADSYTIVFNHMKEKCGNLGMVTRDQVKKAIMTSLYGSKAKPKELFPKAIEQFEETMSEMMPEVWELNKFLSGPAWNPTADEYTWVLPDNFHVHIKVKDLVEHTINFDGVDYKFYTKVQKPTDTGRSLGANLIHSLDGMIVREMVTRCNFGSEVQRVKDILNNSLMCRGTEEDNQMVNTLWNLYKETGFLSARILKYLYSDNIELIDKEPIKKLVNSLPTKSFEILPIHDCFRILPNYGNDLRQQYINLMYEVSKSNLLNYLLKQIGIEAIWIKPYDLSEAILNSEYALS